MTKQEKIREGISQSICRICFDVGPDNVMTVEECRAECVCELNDCETEGQMQLLYSQGLVIKVDTGKVNDKHQGGHLRKENGDMVFDKYCKACKDGEALVGYLDGLFPERYDRVIVEPLIKEK